MKCVGFSIENYKSIRNSGYIEIPEGFTVIVGQNNAGKSALLEAFLYPLRSIPRRAPDSSTGNPLSKFHYRFKTDWPSIETYIKATGAELALGWQGDAPSWPAYALHNCNNLTADIYYQPDAAYPVSYSTDYRLETDGGKGQGTPRPATRFVSTPDRSGVVQAETITTPNSPANFFFDSLWPQVHYFRAERLGISSAPFGFADKLDAAASNLPNVLLSMQGRPSFSRLKRNLSRVFPEITEITVAPNPNQQLEIKIWKDADDRDDLGFSLAECGTGISQAIAILAAASQSGPKIIVIDEPSTFLNPGAARVLIEILRGFKQHRFIVSTHSPEVLSACQPSQLIIAKWRPYETNVTIVPGDDLSSLKLALTEVGCRLADVFGTERIVWVEGPTEQVCFARLLELNGTPLPRSTSFLAMRNTGDFESNPQQTAEIYRRLSTTSALMPLTVGFCFDRELRSDRQIQDIQRQITCAYFTRRRMFESYLLDAASLATFINEIDQREAFDPRTYVDTWISENNERFLPAGLVATPFTLDWKLKVDAATLLKALISDATETRYEYNKVRHGPLLLELVHQNSPDELRDLVELVMQAIQN